MVLPCSFFANNVGNTPWDKRKEAQARKKRSADAEDVSAWQNVVSDAQEFRNTWGKKR